MADDLKALAIVGLYPSGERVWKEVGRLCFKDGDPTKPFLLLDRSFNPAGCLHEDVKRSSTLINFVPLNKQENKDERRDWKNTQKDSLKEHRERCISYEQDDDIPF